MAYESKPGLGWLIGADVSRLFEELGVYSPREEEELVCEVEDNIRNYDFKTGKLPAKRKRRVELDIYELLDFIEERRQLHRESPSRYPADSEFRIICAEIAEKAGIADRVFWTDALKNDPDSQYAKRISEPFRFQM